MKENDVDNVSKELAHLIPNISAKLSPFAHQARGLNSSLLIRILDLLRQKEILTMKEIANEMKISKQQLTPLINKLIQMDLAIRESDDADRRIVRIKITSKGLTILETFQNDIAENIKTRIIDWNEADILSLQNALSTLYLYIDKIL